MLVAITPLLLAAAGDDGDGDGDDNNVNGLATARAVT